MLDAGSLAVLWQSICMQSTASQSSGLHGSIELMSMKNFHLNLVLVELLDWAMKSQ